VGRAVELGAALARIAEAARRGRVEVLCLGNPMRGDDAFGYLVYRGLRRRGVGAVYALAPENVVGLVARRKPSLLVVVDAVLPPTEGIVALELKDLRWAGLATTHTVPLPALLEAAGIDPGSVVIIGVGARRLGLGEPPSPHVLEAAEVVAALLAEAVTSRT